jgi:8-oxo-dGTP diphosphatase
MKARAAIILIENDRIALIERNRSGRYFFVFPGGKVKTSETPVESAAREAEEELGLKVEIGLMVAEVWYREAPQYYFLAEKTGGQFGNGTGSEMSSTPDSKKGSHHPIWMEIKKITSQPVLPKIMAEFVWKSYNEGWQVKPLLVTDTLPDDAGSP